MFSLWRSSGILLGKQNEGSGLAILLVLMFMVPPFVGGLLGVVLVMRKPVLKCSGCGALVSDP